MRIGTAIATFAMLAACSSGPPTVAAASDPAQSADSERAGSADRHVSISPFKVTARISLTYADGSTHLVSTTYRGDARGVIEYQVAGSDAERLYRVASNGVFEFYRKGKPPQEFKLDSSGNLSLLDEWKPKMRSLRVEQSGAGYINGKAAFRIENGRVVDVTGTLLQWTLSGATFKVAIAVEGDDSSRQLAGVVIALLMAATHTDIEDSDWP